MSRLLVVLFLTLAGSASAALPAPAAEPTPAAVAFLVDEADAAKVAAQLAPALTSQSPLTRATAARVAMVRNIAELVPQLTAALAVEKESLAAREQIRALAMLAPVTAIDSLIEASARFPASMDEALSDAVARRGGQEAVDLYLAKLRGPLRAVSSDYFEQALWGRTNTLTATASRLLGARDERGWTQLLGVLRDAYLALDPGVMRASFSSPSEEIRTQSAWFLARAYAPAPDKLAPLVREALLAERVEESSDREEFGIELLRRMLEQPPRKRDRWLKWLGTEEADALLGKSDVTDAYLTDEEVKARLAHCGKASTRCPAPEHEKRRGRRYAAQAVTPDHFTAPSLLPAGLTDEIFSDTRCQAEYIGVASIAADRAGRVQSVDLRRVDVQNECRKALSTIVRLSLADTAAINSPLTSENVLVRGGARTPCLDEPAVQAGIGANVAHRVEGNIKPPVRRTKVDPVFPLSVRRRISSGAGSIVIVESVITRTGCVRNLRLVAQSPFPELNTAALLSLSQWTFDPALLDGKPVDVIFTLTMNFHTN